MKCLIGLQTGNINFGCTVRDMVAHCSDSKFTINKKTLNKIYI